MAHHILKASCQTVHLGGFSHQLEPALKIDSGERIDVETYTGFYRYLSNQVPLCSISHRGELNWL